MNAMRHVSSSLFFLVSFSIVASAQSGFTLDAYKSYLASHQDMTVAEVLKEYPAPLFQSRIPGPLLGVRYLDSVIIKYKLTQAEQSMLARNGFVVSERLSFKGLDNNFGMAFSDIWHKDLPVFITSDAILHAVHMSYDEILKMTEMNYLIPRLSKLLEQLHTKSLPAMDAKYGSDPAMLPMLYDVDAYLTVARKLLTGIPIQPNYNPNISVVTDLMSLIKAESPSNYTLFSTTARLMDFSQFTIRGHYTQSIELGRYFQSMIWLGRTEFMLTKPVQQGPPEQTDEDIQRQIIDSYLIVEGLKNELAKSALEDMDSMIAFLVGESDNVKAAQMELLQQESGFASANDLLDISMVKHFQDVLAKKPFAEQRILSQILMSDPSDPTQLKTPSAFLLLGQRFIIDSYVLGNVVYDKILHKGTKETRMLPWTLDALFALGNDAAAQFLQSELSQWHYAPNLASLRYLIDSYEDDFWNSSLYNTWLHSIRAMNVPDQLDELPPFMHTAAWWQQKMNSQLASWAELRHDNLLYGKQSYTGGASCSYPEGYVEPFPDLFGRLAGFARRAEARFTQTQEISSIGFYFGSMASTMDTLQAIASKERQGVALNAQDVLFIQSSLYEGRVCGETYSGWYARLFYINPVEMPNFVIADVHTAPTDAGGNPVGWVIHAGTGKVNLGIIIAPSQYGGQTAYVGPMMSYYEYTTTNFKRLTDEEWADMITNGEYPRPDWTNNYLIDANGNARVPGPSLLTAVTEISSPLLPAPTVQLDAFPNPIAGDGGTLFRFTLPSGMSGKTTLSIFDLEGRHVRTLYEGTISSGTFMTRWDGLSNDKSPVPSGIYLVQLRTGDMLSTQRVSVTR